MCGCGIMGLGLLVSVWFFIWFSAFGDGRLCSLTPLGHPCSFVDQDCHSNQSHLCLICYIEKMVSFQVHYHPLVHSNLMAVDVCYFLHWTVHLCNYIILVIIPVRFWSTYTSGPFSYTYLTIFSHIITYLGSFHHNITIRYVCCVFRVCKYQRWVTKVFTCQYICP